ncbi:hypothetical protein RFI_06505 [Reticulomyxa filosa]|uniref:Uncharacterized protein n=1 Tax=Reticulomyxa filosa TaxID=46433 RepID=X6NZA3_RETFI|nr:hypothetical protein RFI_06505 [Reticulomyxa filosa]|eukprot:ETO30612.1 hypothetical protein RFI_06505 [Reticulomyxa filosa]
MNETLKAYLMLVHKKGEISHLNALHKLEEEIDFWNKKPDGKKIGDLVKGLTVPIDTSKSQAKEAMIDMHQWLHDIYHIYQSLWDEAIPCDRIANLLIITDFQIIAFATNYLLQTLGSEVHLHLFDTTDNQMISVLFCLFYYVYIFYFYVHIYRHYIYIHISDIMGQSLLTYTVQKQQTPKKKNGTEKVWNLNELQSCMKEWLTMREQLTEYFKHEKPKSSNFVKAWDSQLDSAIVIHPDFLALYSRIEDISYICGLLQEMERVLGQTEMKKQELTSYWKQVFAKMNTDLWSCDNRTNREWNIAMKGWKASIGKEALRQCAKLMRSRLLSVSGQPQLVISEFENFPSFDLHFFSFFFFV